MLRGSSRNEHGYFGAEVAGGVGQFGFGRLGRTVAVAGVTIAVPIGLGGGRDGLQLAVAAGKRRFQCVHGADLDNRLGGLPQHKLFVDFADLGGFLKACLRRVRSSSAAVCGMFSSR